MFIASKQIMYDLIIVGSGLYGATIAFKAKQCGLHCLVLERRPFIGGNIRDVCQEGINVHQYGAHIFHTDEEDIWNFVNQFSSFEPYIHTVLANNEGKLYHLPFNLNTFYDVFGATKPQEVERILEQEHLIEYYQSPQNLQEKAINLIGPTIYNLIVKEYTEKQWGKNATKLSPDIITRLPIRRTYDNRYFSDRYQGIPIDGYTKMIEKMLQGVEVKTGVDFCKNKNYWICQAKHVLYTGSMDELMDYCHGELEYRSLEFVTEHLEIPNYQGTAVINETGLDVPYTRTIEHKHFNYYDNNPFTIITREYPKKWARGTDAYYPVNNGYNNILHQKYLNTAKVVYPTMEFGGRLADYRYYDMDDTIKMALEKFNEILLKIRQQ